ncbi:hypothetical protein BCR35DRAFT_304462 [Leucosporidium creatinivorum]|uniref:G-patch domain-containing protein n=1 Tax=Leucosporidium creatinivorum TaxID=106004 RepID=A0A1Y2F9G0_9BASI|nr:hypothetical protein BCR35DRAFT_304462 [Leucosporidium creatinivorum]
MASARLKRKIENADEAAYGNLNESFVSCGTPLPSLADPKTKDSNEFKPLWQQEVFDEQGRKRLHGAFTGGFSAGYFNTVGSKEGWTPSTFKSSRDNRAQGGNKSVQDAAKSYMDAEDLAEMASSRQLETSSTYKSAPPPPTYDPLMGLFGGAAPSAPTVEPATAALASLIEPASTRVGAKLMRRMGWRDGQGVGPRVTFEQRKKQAVELGLKLDAEEDDEDGAGEASKHYFAPLDRPLKLLEAVGISSDRGWGLGYKPGPNMAKALGVGPVTGEDVAIQTMGDDDDDVYGDSMSMGSLAGGDKKRYGVIELGDEDDDYRMAGSHRRSRPTPRAPPSASQSFHDGARVLPGFELHSETSSGASTSQLPPPPPRGWTPDPARIWTEPSSTDSDKGKGRQLDAEQRGTLLGEPAPPPVPKSVFDYLSAKAKERLAFATSSSAADALPSTPSAPAAPEPDAELHIPPLDGPTALAALKGFQPFSNSSTSPDPIRQKRYTLFLQLSAHLIDVKGSTLPFGPRQLPSGKTQTISELNRELQEYAQAAQVFKPVSGMLAGRFTSGGSGGLVPKVEPGLYQPPAKDPATSSGGLGSFAAAGLEPQLVQKLTPAQEAARAGQWGEATRTTSIFRPAGLVCKRFGVKDPWKGVAEEDIGNDVGGAWKEAGSTGWNGGGGSGGGTKEALGQASMDALMQSSGFKKFQQPMYEEDPPLEDVDVPFSQDQAAPAPPRKQVEKPTLESVGLGDDDKQGEETLTYTKAPKDIFAAIFADSDDEDEDDDDDEPIVQDSAPVKSAILPSSETTSNAPAITSTTVAAPTQPEPEPEPDVSATVLDTSTIADYRPSFVPTSSRATNGTSSSAATSGKKKKSSKRKAATLSFDVDEGEEGAVEAAPKKKKSADGAKRKAKKELKEEDEWAEAPSTVHPEILKAAEAKREEKGAEALGGGRSRASDLF